jgi:hypothetical protein
VQRQIHRDDAVPAQGQVPPGVAPDACTAAPENANALIPFDQIIGEPEQLGVMRLNPRTGDARDLKALREMMCAGHPDDAFRQRLGSMQTDESTTAYAGRAVGRAETWGRLPRTCLRFGKDRSPRPMR